MAAAILVIAVRAMIYACVAQAQTAQAQEDLAVAVEPVMYLGRLATVHMVLRSGRLPNAVPLQSTWGLTTNRFHRIMSTMLAMIRPSVTTKVAP